MYRPENKNASAIIVWDISVAKSIGAGGGIQTRGLILGKDALWSAELHPPVHLVKSIKSKVSKV